jgi:alanine racemase
VTTLRISASAIAHNLRAIRQRTQARILAVVKEDGYGLGLGNARAALLPCGVDFFAVGTAQEALRLKDMGEEEVLLLTPELCPEALDLLLSRGVLFMLGDSAQAEALRASGRRVGRPPRVHLKIDTGLGRYGYRWDSLASVPRDLEGLALEGVYTHFATQTRDYLRVCRRQAARFARALADIRDMGFDPGLTHACASRAFCGLGDLGFRAVRLGSALLGRCTGPLRADFTNAVCLEAPVAQVRLHRRGDVVGYDARCRLARDTLVGLVRVGHADGAFLSGAADAPSLVQALARCARGAVRPSRFVWAGGRPAPLLGNVGMNHLLVDLTDAERRDAVHIDVSPLLVRREIPRQLVAGALEDAMHR